MSEYNNINQYNCINIKDLKNNDTKYFVITLEIKNDIFENKNINLNNFSLFEYELIFNNKLKHTTQRRNIQVINGFVNLTIDNRGTFPINKNSSDMSKFFLVRYFICTFKT